MSRATVLIDKDELLEELLKAESTDTFSTFNELYEYVSCTDWGQNQKKSNGVECTVTVSVIALRVNQWNLKPHLKTTAGKRGGGKSNFPPEQKPRIPRSVKLGKRPDSNEIKKQLEESLYTSNGKYKNLIKQVMKGSMPAVIKAKCLECTNLQAYEVKNCTIKGCPLYALRPFQG